MLTNMSLTSGVKLHIHLLNVVVRFIVFPTLSTLICRGTDISKYFREPLGIRDTESRPYIVIRRVSMKPKLRYYFFMYSLCFLDQLDFDKVYCSNPMTSMVRSEFKI